MATRNSPPALRPFVSRLWASDGVPRHGAGTRRERVLPTGNVHVVLRLGSEPLRIDVGSGEETYPSAVVGGPRLTSYAKDVEKPVPSVGAMLMPGAAPSLFGVPASELAERHTPLELLWGREVERLSNRMIEVETADARLELLMQALATRLPRVRGLHPGVASALDAARGGVDRVEPLAARAGLGPRRFSQLFSESVGLSPKRWLRLRRFQRSLPFARRADVDWAETALELGYADQAHFARDFRAISGLTPTEYRRRAPADPNHVPGD